VSASAANGVFKAASAPASRNGSNRSSIEVNAMIGTGRLALMLLMASVVFFSSPLLQTSRQFHNAINSCAARLMKKSRSQNLPLFRPAIY
jgi:hypothetical protein